MTESTPRVPTAGTLVVDSRRNRRGVVMDFTGSCVQLRPEGGGCEWDARPEDVRPVSAAEMLWPKVQAENSRSTGVRP